MENQKAFARNKVARNLRSHRLYPLKVPGRGLEPLRISPPDPKSEAFSSFATLAQVVSSHGTAAFVLGFVLERKPHTDQALPDLHLPKRLIVAVKHGPPEDAMSGLASSVGQDVRLGGRDPPYPGLPIGVVPW